MHWLSKAVDNITYYLTDDQLAAGAFRKLIDAIRDRFKAAMAQDIHEKSTLFSHTYERTAASPTDQVRFEAWRRCCYRTLGLFVNIHAFSKRHYHHFGATNVDQLLNK
jgi:hypothetical protein